VSYGASHGASNYPILVGGAAGGALRSPGVHVIAPDDLATKVPFTCLRAVGVPIDSWGTDQFAVRETVAGIEA
jgi:hypothetical protein